MQQLGRILVAVAALATTGYGQAQSMDNRFDLDAPSLMGTELPGIFSASSASMPYWSADALDVAMATEYRMSIAGAIKHGLATTTAEPTLILNPPLGFQPGNVPAQLSGSAVAKAEGAFLSSDATAPEPSERMTFLCGLLIAAFIAWRKASWISG